MPAAGGAAALGILHRKINFPGFRFPSGFQPHSLCHNSSELLSTASPKNAISRPLTVSLAKFSCLISKQVHVEDVEQRNFRGQSVNYPQSRCRGHSFLCKVTIAAQSYENPAPPRICFSFILP